MKAIVLREIGSPEKLCLEEVETPKPKANEVVVQLKYASLNRRDLFITQGLYPKIKLPCILGSDGAGEVIAIGEEVKGFQIGSEVIMNPAMNWGPDDTKTSPDYHTLGMPKDGTFAQYIVVSEEDLFPKPEYLSWEEAAALPLAGVTAFSAAVIKGDVKEGETVLIPGIGGGVAQYSLQIAVAKGAHVYVTSGSEEKLARAKQLGAIDGVNYRSSDWVKQLRSTMGEADLIIDGVGGASFHDFIYLTKQGGRIVTYGATSGPVDQFVLPRIFFKNMDIRGAMMGSPRHFSMLLEFFNNHKIRPVIDRSFPLECATEALLYVNKGANFGKITLEIPQ